MSGNHGADREVAMGLLAGRGRQAMSPFRRLHQLVRYLHQCSDIAGWKQHASPIVFDQIAVARNIGRDNWYTGLHGLQDGIRLAFIKAGIPIEIEVRQQLGDIAAMS